MKRCFIGIKLPVPEVDIPEVLTDMTNNQNVKLKLVDPSLFHLTLHFFGDLSDEEVEKAKTVLSKIDYNSFNLTLSGTGSFPKRLNKTRVLFVNVTEGANNLSELTDKITQQLQRNGFKVDKKKLHPHLTVARVKYGDNLEKLAKNWQNIKLKNILNQKIDSFQLFESVLESTGPVYSVIQDFILKDI